MTTCYYCSWMTRGRDWSRRWYVSKMFDTEAEAREAYEARKARERVTFAALWKKVHYEPEELDPQVRVKQPWGANTFDALEEYHK